MAIKIASDIGGPAIVSVVNIAARTTFPEWHDWSIYLMSIVGYVAAWQNWGGDILKQVGVSSLPLTVDKLYERFRSGGVAKRTALVRKSAVQRWPAKANESPFQGVGLV